MKSYLALAWKELKAQKITAILILVAVIMSTIMTTVIGQSIGILQSMRIQQAAGLNGNRYATFHQLGKEQAQKLHEDDRLYDVGDTIFIGSTPLGNSCRCKQAGHNRNSSAFYCKNEHCGFY